MPLYLRFLPSGSEVDVGAPEPAGEIPPQILPKNTVRIEKNVNILSAEQGLKLFKVLTALIS